MDMFCRGPSVEVVERGGGGPPTGIDLPHRDSVRVGLYYLAKIITTLAESK